MRAVWRDILCRHLKEAAAPLVVILGPTASGKTEFSLSLAAQIIRTAPDHGWTGAEIVNADSRQLYRGLDIGTAKIRPGEMQGIPHHLLDVLDPTEEVTIGWYQEHATRTIGEILGRHAVPVLVGGSMLYVSAIIDGLEPLPGADPSVRRRLEAAYDRDRGETLYRRLQDLDPDAALPIHRHNRPYVVRAMEILETMGELPSQAKRKHSSPYDLLILGLRWSHAKIVERINLRTEHVLHSHISMNGYMNMGWVEEVYGLLQQGVSPDAPAMRSHGYREIASRLPVSGCSLLDEREMIDAVKGDAKLCEAIAAKTRQYAKRQMTWWRRDPRIHWLDSG